MLSYQVREYYKYINNRLKDFETNIELILDFGNKYKEVSTDILKKVISTNITLKDSAGTHYVVKDGKIQEQFKSLIKDFKSKFEFFEVFNEYAVLKRDINKYMQEGEINDDSILNLFANIDHFFKLYQVFMQSDNDVCLALDFGQSVKEISSAYVTIVKAYSEMEKNMYDNEEVLDASNTKEFNIQLLEVTYDLEEFANNLKLISKLYDTLGMLIYKETSYEKIQVRKIESGSLLSSIIGDKNIIEVLAIFANKSVNLVFNKFTYEGKIMRHREFRNELMENIKLTERMKELGYDVEDAEKNNNEAVTILTKGLLQLSTSSPKIKIDDNEYSIRDSEKQKFIDSSTYLLLSNTADEDK